MMMNELCVRCSLQERTLSLSVVVLGLAKENEPQAGRYIL